MLKQSRHVHCHTTATMAQRRDLHERLLYAMWITTACCQPDPFRTGRVQVLDAAPLFSILHIEESLRARSRDVSRKSSRELKLTSCSKADP